MQKKRVTFSFPLDAWEGIMTANSQSYQEKIVKFSEDGVPSEIDNPESREDFAINSIMDVISLPWKQMQIQNAIQNAESLAKEQVKTREAEVKELTSITVETTANENTEEGQ